MKRPEICDLSFFGSAALALKFIVEELVRFFVKSNFLIVLIINLVTFAAVAAESWGLLLNKEGTGLGRVCVVYDERNDCQVDDVGTETNIELNENINLRASPEAGSHFVQWVGDCRGRTQTCRMLSRKPSNNKPLTATAIFAQGPAPVMRTRPSADAPKAKVVVKKTRHKAKGKTSKKAKKKKATTPNPPPAQ